MSIRYRVGQGFDFHPLAPGRKLILGGVEIAHETGLVGHSDADVAAHAFANAILGALNKGDLGSHFPDTDARYKNASSLKLLAEVWKMAVSAGYELVNADLTVFAQRPRLAPHLPEMKKRLAAILESDPEKLNIKAASPEGLGALGRGEGLAASAIVLLSSSK